MAWRKVLAAATAATVVAALAGCTDDGGQGHAAGRVSVSVEPSPQFAAERPMVRIDASHLLAQRHDERHYVAGSVRRSADGGHTWPAVDVPEAPAATDPSARSILLASAAGTGFLLDDHEWDPTDPSPTIWRSTDGGDTWAAGRFTTPTGRARVLSVLPNGSALIAFGERATTPDTPPLATTFETALWRSTDDGATWDVVDPQGVPPDEVLDPGSAQVVGPNEVLASVRPPNDEGGERGIPVTYATSDGGRRWSVWQPAKGSLRPGPPAALAIAERATSSADREQLASADGGRTWATLGSPPLLGDALVEANETGISNGAVTPTGVLAVAQVSWNGDNGHDRLVRSTDGGETWRAVPLHRCDHEHYQLQGPFVVGAEVVVALECGVEFGDVATAVWLGSADGRHWHVLPTHGPRGFPDRSVAASDDHLVATGQPGKHVIHVTVAP